jgi:hypothetical protein
MGAQAERPMIDVTAGDEMADDACARANVMRLAAAQTLTGANSAVIFATGGYGDAALNCLGEMSETESAQFEAEVR